MSSHSAGANYTLVLPFPTASLSSPRFQSPAPTDGKLSVLATHWNPHGEHSGQEPADLQGFEDDPWVPGRAGGVVL